MLHAVCHVSSISIQTILMFFLNKMQTFKYQRGHLMVKTENQYSDDLPQAY
jgi:putative flippase GtrA